MSVIKHNLLIFTLLTTTNARSLIVGQRQPDDGPICNGQFYIGAQPGKVPQIWTTCEVTRPEQHITVITVLDNLCRSQGGGHAQIYKGGLCQRTVSISMWGQRGMPLNYTTYVYAAPYNGGSSQNCQ